MHASEFAYLLTLTPPPFTFLKQVDERSDCAATADALSQAEMQKSVMQPCRNSKVQWNEISAYSAPSLSHFWGANASRATQKLLLAECWRGVWAVRGEDPFLTLTCGKCLMKKNDCRKLPFRAEKFVWVAAAPDGRSQSGITAEHIIHPARFSFKKLYYNSNRLGGRVRK